MPLPRRVADVLLDIFFFSFTMVSYFPTNKLLTSNLMSKHFKRVSKPYVLNEDFEFVQIDTKYILIRDSEICKYEQQQHFAIGDAFSIHLYYLPNLCNKNTTCSEIKTQERFSYALLQLPNDDEDRIDCLHISNHYQLNLILNKIILLSDYRLTVDVDVSKVHEYTSVGFGSPISSKQGMRLSMPRVSKIETNLALKILRDTLTALGGHDCKNLFTKTTRFTISADSITLMKNILKKENEHIAPLRLKSVSNSGELFFSAHPYAMESGGKLSVLNNFVTDCFNFHTHPEDPPGPHTERGYCVFGRWHSLADLRIHLHSFFTRDRYPTLVSLVSACYGLWVCQIHEEMQSLWYTGRYNQYLIDFARYINKDRVPIFPNSFKLKDNETIASKNEKINRNHEREINQYTVNSWLDRVYTDQRNGFKKLDREIDPLIFKIEFIPWTCIREGNSLSFDFTYVVDNYKTNVILEPDYYFLLLDDMIRLHKTNDDVDDTKEQ